MDQLVTDICRVVRECGQMLLTADRSHMGIDAKEGAANFVTEYDTRVQKRLFEALGKILPQARFVGEEGDNKEVSLEGWCFIADPIDGTTNFIKDYRVSCVSVGLLLDGIPEIGVVYNPYLDEMFHARRGMGAYCNDKRIFVSRQPLEKGMVVFGTAPYHRDLAEKTFRMAWEYYGKCLDIRRSGSAALDLCAVAAGRAERFFELILQPWDYAAGALLVEEAGGKITTVEGEPITFHAPCSILAGNMK